MDRCLSLWQAPFPIYCATVGICTTLFGTSITFSTISLELISVFEALSSVNNVCWILFLLPSKYLIASSAIILSLSTTS